MAFASAGSWAERLTALLVSPQALLSACPAVGLLDISTITYAEEQNNRLPRPERRGLRSQDGQWRNWLARMHSFAKMLVAMLSVAANVDGTLEFARTS